MWINVECSKCGKKLRASKDHTGRTVRCPKCRNSFEVRPLGKKSETNKTSPVSSAASKAKAKSTTPASAKADSIKPLDRRPKKEPAAVVSEAKTEREPEPEPLWHVRSDDGQEFGPVSRRELESWLSDGRLDSECQLLQEGWDQWCWADEQFPELSPSEPPAVEDDNPFAGLGDESPAVVANRFASPREKSKVVDKAEPDTLVTSGIWAALAETKPWVVFLSILGFIGGGMMALLALMFMVTVGGVAGIIAGIITLAIAACYLFASYCLLTYGKRIGADSHSRSAGHLQAALVAQKSFWKLLGIVTAIAIVLQLIVLGLLWTAAAAILSSMGPA